MAAAGWAPKRLSQSVPYEWNMAKVVAFTNAGVDMGVSELVYYTVTKAVQTYMALSCDTDSHWSDPTRGFNGQARTDELAGRGNHYTATFWEYNALLGRRMNVDPVDQISISNYATFANNPIVYSDPLGNTITSVREDKDGVASLVDGRKPTNKNAQPGEETSKRKLGEKTGLTLSYGADGIMNYAKDETGNPIVALGRFSKSAREDLIKVIDDPNFNYKINWSNGTDILLAESSRRRPGDKEGNMFIDIADFNENDPNFYDMGMNFLHEMIHGYVGLTDAHTPPTPSGPDGKNIRETGYQDYGGKGPTVEKVNIYEQELGYPTRMGYDAIGGYLYFQPPPTIKSNGKPHYNDPIYTKPKHGTKK